jgi:hypothetical protein
MGNPPECPATYAGAMADAAAPCGDGGCTFPPVMCDFPEGVCSCNGGWRCIQRSPPGNACPTDRPRAGDHCATQGQECDYGAPCGDEIWAGPPMRCEGGYWEIAASAPACAVSCGVPAVNDGG